MYLHVDSIADDENKIRILVDIGAALNIENKRYHSWGRSQCHIMISEYFECGTDTEYDFV